MMKMIVDEYIGEFTGEDARRWISLRAIEWVNWPLFVTQPLVPIAFIFLRWWEVVLALVVLNVAWAFIRYRYYNLSISLQGVFFVRLRWIISLSCGLHFFIVQNYPATILAGFWPVLCALIVLPGKLERVQDLIARELNTFYLSTNRRQLEGLSGYYEPASSEEAVLSKLSLSRRNRVKHSVYPK